MVLWRKKEGSWEEEEALASNLSISPSGPHPPVPVRKQMVWQPVQQVQGIADRVWGMRSARDVFADRIWGMRSVYFSKFRPCNTCLINLFF